MNRAKLRENARLSIWSEYAANTTNARLSIWSEYAANTTNARLALVLADKNLEKKASGRATTWSTV